MYKLLNVIKPGLRAQIKVAPQINCGSALLEQPPRPGVSDFWRYCGCSGKNAFFLRARGEFCQKIAKVCGGFGSKFCLVSNFLQNFAIFWQNLTHVPKKNAFSPLHSRFRQKSGTPNRGDCSDYVGPQFTCGATFIWARMPGLLTFTWRSLNYWRSVDVQLTFSWCSVDVQLIFSWSSVDLHFDLFGDS